MDSKTEHVLESYGAGLKTLLGFDVKIIRGVASQFASFAQKRNYDAVRMIDDITDPAVDSHGVNLPILIYCMHMTAPEADDVILRSSIRMLIPAMLLVYLSKPAQRENGSPILLLLPERIYRHDAVLWRYLTIAMIRYASRAHAPSPNDVTAGEALLALAVASGMLFRGKPVLMSTDTEETSVDLILKLPLTFPRSHIPITLTRMQQSDHEYINERCYDAVMAYDMSNWFNAAEIRHVIHIDRPVSIHNKAIRPTSGYEKPSRYLSDNPIEESVTVFRPRSADALKNALKLASNWLQRVHHEPAIKTLLSLMRIINRRHVRKWSRPLHESPIVGHAIGMLRASQLQVFDKKIPGLPSSSSQSWLQGETCMLRPHNLTDEHRLSFYQRGWVKYSTHPRGYHGYRCILYFSPDGNVLKKQYSSGLTATEEREVLSQDISSSFLKCYTSSVFRRREKLAKYIDKFCDCRDQCCPHILNYDLIADVFKEYIGRIETRSKKSRYTWVTTVANGWRIVMLAVHDASGCLRPCGFVFARTIHAQPTDGVDANGEKSCTPVGIDLTEPEIKMMSTIISMTKEFLCDSP